LSDALHFFAIVKASDIAAVQFSGPFFGQIQGFLFTEATTSRTWNARQELGREPQLRFRWDFQCATFDIVFTLCSWALL
jgi:hypothetical protein